MISKGYCSIPVCKNGLFLYFEFLCVASGRSGKFLLLSSLCLADTAFLVGRQQECIMHVALTMDKYTGCTVHVH